MKHIHMYQNVKVYSTNIYYNNLSVKRNINFRKNGRARKGKRKEKGLHISGAWPVEFPNLGLDSPSPQVFWASYLLPFLKTLSLWLLLYVPVLCLSFLLSYFQEESYWVINSGWIWTYTSSATDPKKLGLWACATRTNFCTLYFLLLFFYFSILFIPFKPVSLIHKILNSPIYKYTHLINTNHIIYFLYVMMQNNFCCFIVFV